MDGDRACLTGSGDMTGLGVSDEMGFLSGAARIAATLCDASGAAAWLVGRGFVALHGDAPGMADELEDVARIAAARGETAEGGFEAGSFRAAVPIRDAAGQVCGALCVGGGRPDRLDPARRRALEDLAGLVGRREAPDDRRPTLEDAEAARLRVLLEAITENTEALVFVKRRDGRLLAANRKYHEMARRASVLGLNDVELYGAETGAALRSRDLAVFESGTPFYGEERVVVPDGREITYLSSKFLVRDPTLDDVVLCAIATDITEQKALQRSLEASRREAEAAAVAKSQFLAAMSHEIRTPMNGVLGMLALLAGTELDERQRRMATVARDCAANLLGLLNDILDYARVAAQEAPQAREPFNLRAAISAAVAPVRARAAEKSLPIRVEIDPALPGLMIGDAARFRQVAGALVSNAVKFTEAGEVRVSARWDGGAVRVEVRDTGIGVPEEARGRIFSGFAQGDGSSTRRFGGVGLGLAISRLLVEGMGGTIGFESEEGRGATFWFTAPLDTLAPPDGDEGAVDPAASGA